MPATSVKSLGRAITLNKCSTRSESIGIFLPNFLSIRTENEFKTLQQFLINQYGEFEQNEVKIFTQRAVCVLLNSCSDLRTESTDQRLLRHARQINAAMPQKKLVLTHMH